MKGNSRRGQRRKRKVNNRPLGFPRLLIVTEGTKTETNYFNSIKERIQERFKENIIVDKIDLEVKGIGRGTMGVVEQALKSRNRHTYSQVWVLIDKDNFTDFDQAIKKAEDEGLNVGWSNQSFELWYLLHFQEVSGRMENETIINRLSIHLRQHGITRNQYSKSDPLSYDDLKATINDAIARSKRIMEMHQNYGNKTPSVMNPATTVYKLIEDLLPYLNKDE